MAMANNFMDSDELRRHFEQIKQMQYANQANSFGNQMIIQGGGVTGSPGPIYETFDDVFVDKHSLSDLLNSIMKKKHPELSEEERKERVERAKNSKVISEKYNSIRGSSSAEDSQEFARFLNDIL